MSKISDDEKNGVGVKPLEWLPLAEYGPDAEQASGILAGLYGVFLDEDSAAGAVFAEWAEASDALCTTAAKSLGRFYDWDASKAAAQADYERRILSALTNTDLSLRAENERLRKERDAMSATVQRLVGRGNALVGYLDNPEAIEAGAATAYNAWNHEAQSALTGAVANLKGAE